MKFKEKQRVKVINRRYGHDFKIGSIIEILTIGDGGYYCKEVGREKIAANWVMDNEIALTSGKTPKEVKPKNLELLKGLPSYINEDVTEISKRLIK